MAVAGRQQCTGRCSGHIIPFQQETQVVAGDHENDPGRAQVMFQ